MYQSILFLILKIFLLNILISSSSQLLNMKLIYAVLKIIQLVSGHKFISHDSMR